MSPTWAIYNSPACQTALADKGWVVYAHAYKKPCAEGPTDSVGEPLWGRGVIKIKSLKHRDTEHTETFSIYCHPELVAGFVPIPDNKRVSKQMLKHLSAEMSVQAEVQHDKLNKSR